MLTQQGNFKNDLKLNPSEWVFDPSGAIERRKILRIERRKILRIERRKILRIESCKGGLLRILLVLIYMRDP